ncbi:MAG: GatB/YqeY domain-containing protein [bacterium]
MGLKQQIMDDFKIAMKTRDKEKLSTLKMIKSALRNKEIDSGSELDEDEIRALLAKEAKQRKDSIKSFEAGGREKLAEKEKRELEFINSYLPESLGGEELETLVDEIIAETGASSMADMGTVMSTIMPRVRGRADGSDVQQLVREKLGA